MNAEAAAPTQSIHARVPAGHTKVRHTINNPGGYVSFNFNGKAVSYQHPCLSPRKGEVVDIVHPTDPSAAPAHIEVFNNRGGHICRALLNHPVKSPSEKTGHELPANAELLEALSHATEVATELAQHGLIVEKTTICSHAGIEMWLTNTPELRARLTGTPLENFQDASSTERHGCRLLWLNENNAAAEG